VPLRIAAATGYEVEEIGRLRTQLDELTEALDAAAAAESAGRP
jgi:hypothetical protein